jgi:hypothetical protein
MAMSRKHYNAVASVLSGQLTGPAPLTASWDVERQTERRVIENVARGLSNLFADDNPNFDRERFLAACGVDK